MDTFSPVWEAAPRRSHHSLYARDACILRKSCKRALEKRRGLALADDASGIGTPHHCRWKRRLYDPPPFLLPTPVNESPESVMFQASPPPMLSLTEEPLREPLTLRLSPLGHVKVPLTEPPLSLSLRVDATCPVAEIPLHVPDSPLPLEDDEFEDADIPSALSFSNAAMLTSGSQPNTKRAITPTAKTRRKRARICIEASPFKAQNV